MTVIYFLLPGGAVSRWHRIRSDEVWQHVEGAPLELLQLQPGEWRLHRNHLGSPATDQQTPLHCVPAGWWQAARCLGPYGLVSCAVAPGFEFSDFELLAGRAELAAELGRALPEAVGFL